MLPLLQQSAVIEVRYLNPNKPAISNTAQLYRWDSEANAWTIDGINRLSRSATSVICTTMYLGTLWRALQPHWRRGGARALMKIGIVGAGPAGLYFALLMKRADRRLTIRIVEQRPRGATYGWGIVFSGRARALLEQHDPLSYRDIAARLRSWDTQHICHRGEIVPIDGSHFSGISRAVLLTILQEHCLAEGVAIDFETPLADLSTFADCDLIVGADGVHSLVRAQHAAAFQPTMTPLSNKYVWYGSSRLFPALALIFRANADGCFVAHAYPYSETTSTFIVECDARTWQAAGFAEMADAESRAYCERLFAADLGGACAPEQPVGLDALRGDQQLPLAPPEYRAARRCPAHRPLLDRLGHTHRPARRDRAVRGIPAPWQRYSGGVSQLRGAAAAGQRRAGADLAAELPLVRTAWRRDGAGTAGAGLSLYDSRRRQRRKASAAGARVYARLSKG